MACWSWRRTITVGAIAVTITGAMTGCSPVGFIVNVGGLVTEDRTAVARAQDIDIKLSIDRAMLDSDSKMFGAVSVQVWEGRVVLTGAVINPEHKNRAKEIAKGIPGVKSLIDEIQIVSESSSLSAFTSDVFIEERLKARFLMAKEIDAPNYSVRAVNGVVYLLGIAHSQDELDQVLAEARVIDSVKRVVSHVRIRARAAQTE